ncbi:MAG: Branched-chain amino acid aminotransferase [Candidatus Roizmanbacteria bacterium GW2011_GWA2_35_19]|uniref:Branched-chain-amino-acid aminotransferase n=2 Tax=Candidatus Roizmaniibacteriota TaxID=1752723 RepID=A0A0G0BUZ2_9BACT|nr:MAG: Branched-chain amino acid aminotransferase [Candidatus Roizmanbacteria bacterium GW2011_GWC2_35_12]KKP73113.1 MAG: Branched-chain amino acid aminotransferase [Candidatus Roizmanbacteria bacterium GW2011_GWA2_35_19]
MKLKDFCQKAFFQGTFINIEDAKIPVMTNALHYGNGVFGGLRGYYNGDKKFLSLFRLKDHYNRLLSSLKILGVSIPYSQSDLVEITTNLVKKNKPNTDVYLRPLAYAKSLNISPSFEKDKIFDFCLFMFPLGEYLPINKGLSTMITTWRRVSDTAIPARAKITGAYVNSSLAHQEAVDNGYDEAIFLTENGQVSEGSAANLFIVRDGVLITASKTDDVLEGVTRKTILELAKNLKIPTEERLIDKSELYISNEAFFSGTGVQISWISKVDKRMVGNGKKGPVTEKLQNLFFKVVRGNNDDYKNWLTVISF